MAVALIGGLALAWFGQRQEARASREGIRRIIREELERTGALRT